MLYGIEITNTEAYNLHFIVYIAATPICKKNAYFGGKSNKNILSRYNI